ncbi:MAG: helix-turn-helix domain-containing protein [Dehalococcoidia bacterium]|nr:helix-turn-helix domain-containing protein [Dehalococcoidia bacterium]
MKDINRNSKRRPFEKFGEYLRSLRIDRTEFIQAEAARRIGLTRQELNYYEKGTRMPSDTILIRLAHLYHMATAEILERAYWPQLVLLPLIAIIDPDQLSRDLIEELEKGLKEKERKEITQHIEELLHRRDMTKQR